MIKVGDRIKLKYKAGLFLVFYVESDSQRVYMFNYSKEWVWVSFNQIELHNEDN